MTMKRIGSKKLEQSQELNITAFMNLMVILIPFLLITAVFSRMTVLELNLPGLGAKDNAEKPVELQLQLVVSERSFDIRDANLGLIRQFERSAGETRWDRFRDLLVQIKSRYPDEKEITLLLEPGVKYKTLIQIMDSVRSAEILDGLGVRTVELFPDISIGDATPPVAPGGKNDN